MDEFQFASDAVTAVSVATSTLASSSLGVLRFRVCNEHCAEDAGVERRELCPVRGGEMRHGKSASIARTHSEVIGGVPGGT